MCQPHHDTVSYSDYSHGNHFRYQQDGKASLTFLVTAMNAVPSPTYGVPLREAHSANMTELIFIYGSSHFECYVHLPPSFICPDDSIKSRNKLSKSSFYILMNQGSYDRFKLTILQMIMEGLRIQSGTQNHAVGLWQLSPELSPGKATMKWPAEKNQSL